MSAAMASIALILLVRGVVQCRLYTSQSEENTLDVANLPMFAGCDEGGLRKGSL